MSLIEIFTIIIVHWIADFIMQDEKWALGKSKNWSDLLTHTFVYSSIWFIIGAILILSNILIIEPFLLYLFFWVTFILHTATDYFTSRIVSKQFVKETIITTTFDDDDYDAGDIINSGKCNSYIVVNKIDGIDLTGKIKNDPIIKAKYKIKRYNPIPNFGAFATIGFDQVLHYIQLFSTYYLLTKI